MSTTIIRRTVSQPADGADFIVTLDSPQPDADYGLTSEIVKGSKIPKIDTPEEDFAADQFRVITSAPLSHGDVLEFILVHA